MKFRIFTAAVTLAITLMAHSAPYCKSDKQAAQWADSVMSTMSLRQRVAQLFCPRLDVRDNTTGRQAIRTMVQHEHVGGILLGKGSITEYANLNNYAQSLASPPLMITLDGEWGPAMRLTDAVRFPYNIALGAIRDTTLMYEYGLEVAKQCRMLGINVDFAPVLDVNSNPQNPVIGYRSFGENAERVAALGIAYSRGLEAGGVMSVAKHFPGHGDTSVDSHKALPTVNHSRDVLDATDILPFKRYIDSGLSGIMVGHLKVPALDNSGTPASLSHKITSRLLKEQMHFQGLVFTDALAMKGAVSGINNCVTALKAGADVLLGSASPTNDISAVVKAVNTGQISEAIINERCRKLLIYKYRMGLSNYTPVETKGIIERINSPQANALIEKLANASITVLRNNNSILPIKDLAHNRIAIVNVGASGTSVFEKTCTKYSRITHLTVNDHGLTHDALTEADKTDIIIVAIYGAPQTANAVLNQLKGKQVVTVYFESPFRMPKIPELGHQSTLVMAYDKNAPFQRAAAMALFGGINVSGRFPVNIKGIATEGEGIDLYKTRLGHSFSGYNSIAPRLNQIVDSICTEAIEAKAMSGCQVVIAYNGNIITDKAYGHINYGKNEPKVTDTTLFDIASMTKACATLPGLMLAIDEDLIDIDAPVSRYIPELLESDKDDITVRQLLLHESGMPPTLNMWKLMMDTATYTAPLIRNKLKYPNTIKIENNAYGNKDAKLRTDILSHRESDEFYYPVAEQLWISDAGIDSVTQAIHNAPLRKKQYLYSCLNFCLLKEAQENVTGVPLDQWIDTGIFAPLGAWHTTFLPHQAFDADDIAYTEIDNFLRKQHIHGYVHDELAAFSGGVQGNAGLFANAGDIAKYGQMLLNGGEYGGERILSKPTVKRFMNTISESDRALGFDMLRRNRSLAPDNISTKAVGHTGSTGTCFWIDAEHNLIIVILTNRMNPSRNNAAFSRLNPRGAIIRAIYSCLN